MPTQSPPRPRKRPRSEPTFRRRRVDELEPDLHHLETTTPYRDPSAPRIQRTKEEQERLDEKVMALRAHGKTFRQIAALLAITVSSAHGRLKRHLHRQRVQYHEHMADIRDYDLLKIQLLEPVILRNAQDGDPRAAAQFMRLVELRHKLLKIKDPTNIEELMRKQDFAHAVAKGYSDEAIEAAEGGSALEDQKERAENSLRTKPEQTSEHEQNTQSEPVADTQVTREQQIFSQPQNEQTVGDATEPTADLVAQVSSIMTQIQCAILNSAQRHAEPAREDRAQAGGESTNTGEVSPAAETREMPGSMSSRRDFEDQSSPSLGLTSQATSCRASGTDERVSEESEITKIAAEKCETKDKAATGSNQSSAAERRQNVAWDASPRKTNPRKSKAPAGRHRRAKKP